ncbi:HAMP domain-containing sensor histidine kinase [Vibrio sp. TH_r3]|uniref:sensor histidine kinase n=1 Tax=Vibrio sp. TH_r3 TaxID=3082084 RepID=UPI0029542E9F|nr:HAMP domain-containing sensor histidine kinase [Vibrio sp. TH_r3]MDV7103614.1 HAMP domain-containing sensor histidine kinase [Vibrio sp. TH_r3]
MKDISKLPRVWLGKFTAVLIGLITLTIVSGSVFYQYRLDLLLTPTKFEHEAILNDSLATFNRALGDMGNSITWLYKTPTVTQELEQDSDQLHFNTAKLAQIFAVYGESVGSLLQVRWLDNKGQEKVRVDVKNGQSTVVSERFLQNKMTRYYFKETMNTPYPMVYFSPIDLNIENEVIQTPYQPTIRVGLQTGNGDSMRKGALILNYDLINLFNQFRHIHRGQTQLEIIDQSGFWLLNPDKNKEWGGDIEQYANNLSVIDLKLWQHTQEKHESNAVLIDNQLISYRRTDITSDNSQNNAILFMALTPPSVIKDITRSAFYQTLILVCCIISIGGFILYRDMKFQLTLFSLNKQLIADKNQLKINNQKMTELLEQQHQLQADLVKSEKLSALGMMVAGVAHELNTPIGASILVVSKQCNSLNSLQEKLNSGLKKSTLHQYIQNNAVGLDLLDTNLKRAAELIRSFKRLAIDRAKDDVISFELEQVVDDLIRSLFHEAKTQQVEIVSQIEKDLTLTSHPGVLSQVLQNLVINSLTHAFKANLGGEITICAKMVQNNFVEIDFTDDGRGISTDILPKIFEPFVTTNRSNGNTGLGLHFVSQWVDKSLQGTISVESKLNHGTKFKLVIPLDISPILPSD